MPQFKEKMPEKVQRIVEVISTELGISVDRIIGRNRRREVIEARHTCIHILYKQIYKGNIVQGRLAGWFNKDHTTVIHALGKIDFNLKHYEDYSQKYFKITRLVHAMSQNELERMTYDERIGKLSSKNRTAIIYMLEQLEKLNEID